MSLTLDDVAAFLDTWGSNEQAALCRAAAKVIEVVRKHECMDFRERYSDDCPVCEALAVYEAVSRGDQ